MSFTTSLENDTPIVLGAASAVAQKISPNSTGTLVLTMLAELEPEVFAMLAAIVSMFHKAKKPPVAPQAAPVAPQAAPVAPQAATQNIQS